MDSGASNLKDPHKDRMRLRRGTAPLAFLVVLLIGAAVVWRLGVVDVLVDRLAFQPRLPEDGRPAFLATTYSRGEIPSHATLMQRLLILRHDLNRRLGRKNPAAWKFSPSPAQPCGVEGLLNQCMDLTGTRYLIAREALGAVYFGHTNTLNGSQWVAAFEQALRDADLLLIREPSGVVKVIPKSVVAEYRKAGLVRDGE